MFEFSINDKVVFSRRLLNKYPDIEEMVEIARWINKVRVLFLKIKEIANKRFIFQGKTFMHMFLCSFCEGGEPRMIVADRKATPLAKRLILACTIQ